MMIEYLVLAILLLAAVATVVSPKAWHRAVCLIMCGILVFFFVSAMSENLRRGLAAQYFHSIVRPTAELWDITAENLVSGDVTQALSDVRYIKHKWTDIVPWNDKYTAAHLLRELRERQSANQASEVTARRLAEPQR